MSKRKSITRGFVRFLTEKKSFPRTTSGLTRGIGPITAMFVTVAFVLGVAWQFWIFNVPRHAPLPDNLWFAGIPPAVMAFTIDGIIILVMMLGYSVLVSAMPRSGGGYVVISRILGPFGGFLCSWLEFLSFAFSFGIIAVAVFEIYGFIVGPALGIIVLPSSSFPYNDVGLFAGGMILVAVITATVALGNRITSFVLQTLVWVPAALGLYVIYLLGLAIANPAILQNGITVWAQSHGMAGVTADTYVKGALAQGLDSASVGNYWTAVSGSLLAAIWTLSGFAGITFVAGEIKTTGKNLPRILLLAPLIAVVMFVTMTAFGVYATASVGQTTLPNGDRWSFYDAFPYLTFRGNPEQAGVPPFRPWLPTVASMIGFGAGLGSLNILLLVFSTLWVLNDLPAMALTASRIIFAMSFDRVLPTSFSKVQSRFRSPIYATILVGVFAIMGTLSESCVFCNGGSWSPGGPLGDLLTSVFVNGVVNTDVLDLVFFTLFSLAVVLFPLRFKRIFDVAPFKPGGKLGVVAIGLSGLIANLIIGLALLTSPANVYNLLEPTADSWFALGFATLLAFIGCLICAYYRLGPSTREVDYSVIFSEIPPE